MEQRNGPPLLSLGQKLEQLLNYSRTQKLEYYLELGTT
jgi:hypothetical protein